MKALRSLATSAGILVVALSSGCAVSSRMDNLPQQETFATVNVFYATNRKATDSENPYDRYTSEPGTEIAYGTCEVSIPRDHRMGVVEASFLDREWLEDPETDVVLHATRPMDAAAFFQNAGRDSAFVFVHGFNVKFGDAAKRTAQMTYDLGFKGAPIFFSWPASGTFTPGSYGRDETRAAAAAEDLKRFLRDYLERTHVRSLYLIAHSMGNRPMTKAVAALLRENPAYRGRIREIILTAPDMDEKVFRDEIAPVFTPAADGTRMPVTLYVSSRDRALGYATTLLDGRSRLGDASGSIPVYPGVRTIDASAVDTSFSGHCYYAENRSVMSDIFYLMRQDPEDRFGMKRKTSSDGEYWTFRP